MRIRNSGKYATAAIKGIIAYIFIQIIVYLFCLIMSLALKVVKRIPKHRRLGLGIHATCKLEGRLVSGKYIWPKKTRRLLLPAALFRHL